MDISKIFLKYKAHTAVWTDALKKYDPETFNLQPAPDEWSMAQVYDHIINVSQECMKRSLQCVSGDGEKGHWGFGPALFSLMGSFPPIKIKVEKSPAGLEHLYHPREITMDEAKKGLAENLSNMQDLLLAIPKAASNTRVAHWAGGWFNAAQWYHSAEMHLKHHFRQKKRIDNYLSKRY